MDVLPEGVSAPIKKGPCLYDFLVEAELAHYFHSFKNNLKVSHPSQLKFATDEDLVELGMSKPEMRRMRKFYDKHFTSNYLTRFKKLLTQRKQSEFQSTAVGFSSSDIMVFRNDGMGGVGSVNQKQRVPNKHIISPANITVNKELGMGEFGVVQQGVWCNEGERIQVAIKCLVRERMQTNTMEFLKEAVIMHSIDHPHIVRLFGVVLDMGSLMLVTELAPLRSLLECLKEPSVRSSFPVLTLCDFAVQICDGMQYLEAKRFIHRDLAARNILVFSKNKVKISDFGLSRALGQGKDYYQTNFNVNLKLPIAWCAPECISYLRFTTASDVWAYGVTLWEMFSYGFQPWAALTGQQILEAIDEPNFQRLEQPDCCPQEYYTLMVDCWRHDAAVRPRFMDISGRLSDCRPEQVQCRCSCPSVDGPHMIPYRQSDVLTVLDKICHRPLWKGVTASGKTGFFDPCNVVAYLGSDLPGTGRESAIYGTASSSPSTGSGGSSSMASLFGLGAGSTGSLRHSIRRPKIRSEMISAPQGEVKHTGHVGLDGAYFGDLSFLEAGSKSDYGGIPTQVVPPYRPHENLEAAPLLLDSGGVAVNSSADVIHSNQMRHITGESISVEPAMNQGSLDHEYHEISDEEQTNRTPPLDLGPSLMDEMQMMFSSLGGPPPPPSPADHDGSNKTNELRERMNAAAGNLTKSRPGKQAATVKPISAQDEKTLDTAIALANELSARSLSAPAHHGYHGSGTSVPLTPTSPNKRKFIFRFPSVSSGSGGGSGGAGSGSASHTGSGGTGNSAGHADGASSRHGSSCSGGNHSAGISGDGDKVHTIAAERRTSNFAEEAQSTPDIQSKLTQEAQLAYHSLVESPSPELSQYNLNNPLRLLRSGQLPLIKPRTRTTTLPSSHVRHHEHRNSNDCCQVKQDDEAKTVVNNSPMNEPSNTTAAHIGRTQHIVIDHQQSPILANSSSAAAAAAAAVCRPFSHSVTDTCGDLDNNPIPLPPRDRNKPLLLAKPRHTRKHPLIIPPTVLQATLHKFNASEQSEISEAVENERAEPIYSNHQLSSDNESVHFEAQIESNLAALDHMNTDVQCLKRNTNLASLHRAIAVDCVDGPDVSNEPTSSSMTNRNASEHVDLSSGSKLQRHHVSVEDLLEFADAKPSSRERGLESDEVRIMSKVLGKDFNSLKCVETLEFIDWDVMKAIKLCRLQKLVEDVELQCCFTALETTNWDVTKAAQWIIQQDTEVQV